MSRACGRTKARGPLDLGGLARALRAAGEAP